MKTNRKYLIFSTRLLCLTFIFLCSSCVSLDKYRALENRIESLEKMGGVLDLTDTDGDGVIDLLDQDPDSEPGCSVDVRGIAIDSDGDGYIDCKDYEPFSPTGYDVDNKGIAPVPAPSTLSEVDVNRIVDAKLSRIPQKVASSIKGDIDFPVFPWKPPVPSTSTVLSRSKYFANATTYGEINTALVSALKEAGFPDSRNYFQIHTDKDKSGFALVSHIEQIDENGNPLPGDARFNSHVNRIPGTGILASLLAMWHANVGHFRIYVFMVMDGNVWPSGAIITKEDALTKDLTGGAPNLHHVIEGMPVTKNVECTVLLYEFEQHENDKNGVLIRKPKLDGMTHLKKSGILDHLLKE